MSGAASRPNGAPLSTSLGGPGYPQCPTVYRLLGPEHVRDVMAHLKPARLGHGVRAAEDMELTKRIIDAGVAFEVCPESNVSLGFFLTKLTYRFARSWKGGHHRSRR